MGPGDYFLVVEGGYRGEVALSFSPQAEICDDAAILAQDEDVDIGSSNAARTIWLSRHCCRSSPYRFTVDEPSMVTLAIDSDDANANASIRSVCDTGLSEIQCVSAGQANRAQHMLAGTYYAVFHGDEPIAARLNIEPGGHLAHRPRKRPAKMPHWSRAAMSSMGRG